VQEGEEFEKCDTEPTLHQSAGTSCIKKTKNVTNRWDFQAWNALKCVCGKLGSLSSPVTGLKKGCLAAERGHQTTVRKSLAQW